MNFLPYAFAIVILMFVTNYGIKLLFHRDITWVEFAISFLFSSIMGITVIGAGMYGETRDREILSGHVISKSRVEVSCEHSYPCNCYTSCSGSGSSRTCSQHCSTCYEHSHDYSWEVKSNVGLTYISRVNRRGDIEPPRWTRVQMGEAFAVSHNYTNWIKAAPDSLFHAMDMKGYEKQIPKYPEIYDYYRTNRVLPTAGVKVPNLNQWNQAIADGQKVWGPTKQANVIVIFVNAGPNYVEHLKAKWLGGKKNDIVIVVGMKEYPKIEWVEIMSWTDSQLFKVQLRDSVQSLGEVSPESMVETINEKINLYVRKPASDFEYLKDRIHPPLWAIIMAFVFSFLTAIGMGYFTKSN